MRAVGDEAVEPRFGFGHCVRFGETNRVEATRTRLFDQGGFDFVRIGHFILRVILSENRFPLFGITR
jgi:hypothetical protein